jgi:hypothetical protein
MFADRRLITMLCFAFLAIVFGVLSIFAKDVVWDLTHFQNQLNGVASERSEVWEAGTTISGVVMLIVGVVFLIGSFSTEEPRPVVRLPSPAMYEYDRDFDSRSGDKASVAPYPGSVEYAYGTSPVIDQVLDSQVGNQNASEEVEYYRVIIDDMMFSPSEQIVDHYLRELDGTCTGQGSVEPPVIMTLSCQNTTFGTVNIMLYKLSDNEILISQSAGVTD